MEETRSLRQPAVSRRRRKVWVTAGLIALAVTAAAVTAGMSVSGIRWRAEVILMKASGKISGIGWVRMLSMLRPHSPINLEPLRRTPNLLDVIRNPYTSDADRAAGKKLFQARCTPCHGDEGRGGTAPSLVGRRLKVGDASWSLFQTLTGGMPGLGMPRISLPDHEIWQIIAYLHRLRLGTNAVGDATARTLHLPESLSVTAKRLENAAAEPNNWLTYSGSYRSWRYSALDGITASNVGDLKLAWSLQLDTTSAIEASPIVVDGIMYVSVPPSDVMAIDAATGDPIWQYRRSVPASAPVCCGRTNRGVAIFGDRVFIGTLDGYLVALDARTGKVVWQKQVAESDKGYSITAAPLAVRGKIIVGVSGSEFGIRGFIDAYDAESGKRLWRFHTIPKPGQVGSDTWGGESWRHGGGSTWITGSYDSNLNLVYWGVGNPAPDWNGDVRPGDNLYTDSVVALDADTGKLAWHFQFTPHDDHDWDSAQVPVLVDHSYDGRRRKLMLWPNRNGFYYVLDRQTGKFLHSRAFVKQTWANRINAQGRPVLSKAASPSRGGTLIWPGQYGGGDWWSPSYSPKTDLIYVPFAEAPSVFIKGADTEASKFERGKRFLGSAVIQGSQPMQAGIRALNPVTGKRVWQYLRAPRRNLAAICGVLATAGNVVFAGDGDDFVAFNARSGKELWRTRLGGNIHAAPVTFAVDGVQMVAIPAGNALFVFRP